MKRTKVVLIVGLLAVVGLAPLLLAQDATPQAPQNMQAFVPVQAGPVAPQSYAAAPTNAYHPRRVLVKLKPGAIARSTLGVSVLRGINAGDAETGLLSIDAIGWEKGLESIERSTIEVQSVALDESIGVSRWFSFVLPEGQDLPALAARYADDPDVEIATLDWRAFPAVSPNDPNYPDHWGHHNTGQLKDYCWGCGGHPNGTPVGTPGFDAHAEAAWAQSQGYGSSGVVIAIIDSGVDANHPDLRQVTGWDFGNGDNNPDDDSGKSGHGTACAGIAAAKANNHLGPAGIAGACSIMPLKVANSAGTMYFSAIQNAIYYAADHGAKVISMSFGSSGSGQQAMKDALLYAHNKNVIMFAATGNENMSTISFPASDPHVIGIGAASPCGDRKRSSSNSSEVNPGHHTDPNGTTCDGERWWGSNYGVNTIDHAAAVDLLGPTILPTTDIGGRAGYSTTDYYQWFNGTSAATPYVAGVAALILTAHPNWTPAQVRQRLISTATDIVNVESGNGWDRYSGYGLVNADAALGGGGSSGPSYTALPYSTGFESGSLDSYWTTASTADGRVRILTTNAPHSGSRHLTMDDSTNGGFSQNEARLHLDLSAESNVKLDFWWKEFGDETHAQDGVYFSDNGGSSFVKVKDLNGGSVADKTWQHITLDLDQLATSKGLSLTATFVVKFQQYDNYPMTSDGFAFDDISVTAVSGPVNSLTVTYPNGGETLTVGEHATITWSSTGSIANVALDYSTNGGSSWHAITSSTANDGSFDWTVPSDETTRGRVRVSDVAASSTNDVSNANFTIKAASSTPYTSIPYSTGFESGSLDNYWSTNSTGNGRVRILSSNGPHAGSYHMTMDDSTSGGFSRNEAWLHVNLSAETSVNLEFWWKEFSDETHSQDGIYFSDNGGTSFVKVKDLNGGSVADRTWQRITLDVDQLASNAGLTLSSTFVIKFQQYDNYPMTSDGFAFDEIALTAGSSSTSPITAESEPNDNSASADGPLGNGTAVSGTLSSSNDDDWFYFDVSTAGSVEIVLDILGSQDFDWYLYHESNLSSAVARGYTTNDPESGSYNCSVARYYIRVDGYHGATGNYTLTVNGTGVSTASPQGLQGLMPVLEFDTEPASN